MALPVPISGLGVWCGESLAGTLHDTTPMAFEYTPAWLARTPPVAMSAIPLAPGRNDSAAVQAFFENLLPEGELRDYLSARKKASTLFALLREVAGDTAGGFVILPGGQHPASADENHYPATSWKALAAKLRKKTASDIMGRDARISLAGAQAKISIALFADGIPRLPRGTAPSTHILKPDIRRLARVWHSAVNETIIMLTAARCGLPTAEVFYEPHTQACLVRRFDRVMQTDGALGRLIQYDLCQLTGIRSEKKYEKEGGPGVAACAGLIRTHSTGPAADLRHFVLWILFNLYTGNNDSHAKNLSLLEAPGGGAHVSVTLAPFYDLMATRLYPGLSADFAFAIGGETRPGAVTGKHLDAMAAELGMRPQFIASLAVDLAHTMPAAIDAATAAVLPLLTPGAKALAQRLKKFVVSNTAKTARRIAR